MQIIHVVTLEKSFELVQTWLYNKHSVTLGWQQVI